MKFLIIIVVVLLLLALIAFFVRETVLQAVGDFLVIQDDLYPVDVIHVIAGADHRTEHAIQLYKQGYAKTLFFTGGWYTSHNYYHGEHGFQQALAQGVPKEAIDYDDSPVTSTYSETVLLKAWIDQSPAPISSVIVVSDPFHMRRARWTARQVLGEGVEILMAPVPFEKTPYNQQWWVDETSQRYVKEEYQKLVYYLLRYKYSWGWLSEWLASYDTG